MFPTMVVSWLSIVGVVPLGPKWTDDYSEALASARNSHRPLVVVLEQPAESTAQVDRLRRVSPSILMRFQVCQIDATSSYGKRIANLYGATELPYTVITDTDCREILFRGTGKLSTKLLAKTLNQHVPQDNAGEIPAADVGSNDSSPAATEDGTRSITVRKLVTDAGSPTIADSQPRLDSSDRLRSELQAADALRTAFGHVGLDDARLASENSRRPLLVVVSMQNCHFCDKLKAETLSRTSVKEEIAEKFESVMIEDTENEDWVESQGVSIFPTTLIVSPQGNLIDRIEGFVGPEQLSARLQNVQSRLYSSR